jgi:hypothetical protein
MAYTPNANRQVRGGKAMVSAKELADFKSEFGSDKTLTDLLNMDKGLQRKIPSSTMKSVRESIDKEQSASPLTRSAALTRTDNYKPRDEYVRSGRKSFDTETEFVPPNMDEYKPRRMPKSLTEVTKPGSSVNYENKEVSDMSFKRGGKVSGASKRADGIAQRGKTRGRLV